MAGLFFSPSSILMACKHPTVAVVAILCTSLLPMQGQVTIPRNLPLMPGVGQEAIFKQPAMRKDFRAVDFEVGPASNRSSMLMSVGEGFNTNLDLEAFDLPFLLVSTLIALALMLERFDVTRAEGVVLCLLFGFYLYLRAAGIVT